MIEQNLKLNILFKVDWFSELFAIFILVDVREIEALSVLSTAIMLPNVFSADNYEIWKLESVIR